MRREPLVSDLFFQLDLRLNSEKGGDTSTYVTNGEWDLQGEPCLVSSVLLCPDDTPVLQLLATFIFQETFNPLHEL